MKNLLEKKIIITGGASGIGKSLSRKLVKLGATVFILDNDIEEAQNVAQSLRSSGGKAFAFHLDLSSLESIKKCKSEISARGIQIDVLINNASLIHRGDFEKISLEKHFEMYKVNTEGLVAMTHIFFADLRQSQEAHLVNIASVSDFLGFPYGSTYTSSKSAVVNFSESLRKELVERSITNIHITTVCPSLIDIAVLKGFKSPFVAHFLTADFIAEKIIHGIRHNKALIKEPIMIRGMDFLRGVLPSNAFNFLTRFLDAPKEITHTAGKKA